jgi:hypothetical protein
MIALMYIRDLKWRCKVKYILLWEVYNIFKVSWLVKACLIERLEDFQCIWFVLLSCFERKHFSTLWISVFFKHVKHS